MLDKWKPNIFNKSTVWHLCSNFKRDILNDYKLNCLFLFLLSIRIENFLLKLINLLLKQKRFLNPASNYLPKGKAKNTRLICEICPKLTRTTHNDIIDIILVSSLQLWIYFRHFPGDSLAVFEQVNVYIRNITRKTMLMC